MKYKIGQRVRFGGGYSRSGYGTVISMFTDGNCTSYKLNKLNYLDSLMVIYPTYPFDENEIIGVVNNK